MQCKLVCKVKTSVTNLAVEFKLFMFRRNMRTSTVRRLEQLATKLTPECFPHRVFFSNVSVIRRFLTESAVTMLAN